MSYLERAIQFLQDLQQPHIEVEVGNEINEINEISLASPRPETSVWWNDDMPSGSSPILCLPPRQCLGPRACARLGSCDRYAAGQPCHIT